MFNYNFVFQCPISYGAEGRKKRKCASWNSRKEVLNGKMVSDLQKGSGMISYFPAKK